MDKNQSFLEQMYAACDQIGIKPLSDDTVCRLLAVVYLYGDESAVYSDVMRHDISVSQDRAKMRPGMRPDPLLLKRITEYVRRMKDGDDEWVKHVSNRYGVTFPKYSKQRREEGREAWQSMHTYE